MVRPGRVSSARKANTSPPQAGKVCPHGDGDEREATATVLPVKPKDGFARVDGCGA